MIKVVDFQEMEINYSQKGDPFCLWELGHKNNPTFTRCGHLLICYLSILTIYLCLELPDTDSGSPVWSEQSVCQEQDEPSQPGNMFCSSSDVRYQ